MCNDVFSQATEANETPTKEITMTTNTAEAPNPKGSTDSKTTTTKTPPAPVVLKPMSATAKKTVLGFNKAWSDADRTIVSGIMDSTSVIITEAKPSTAGDVVRLLSGTKTIAWVNANRIDFPDHTKIRFSTARQAATPAEKEAAKAVKDAEKAAAKAERDKKAAEVKAAKAAKAAEDKAAKDAKAAADKAAKEAAATAAAQAAADAAKSDLV